jgi:hypothetical protein
MCQRKGHTSCCAGGLVTSPINTSELNTAYFTDINGLESWERWSQHVKSKADKEKKKKKKNTGLTQKELGTGRAHER